MILRRLSLSNWRAHAQLDLRFGAGLNVVVGRNESGKSSLVEALDWALFRDITGGAGRLKSEDIKCIIPATDPNAKPRVEVEIEFHNCTAVVSKVVCEDANKRECRLCLRQNGQPDEWFERTEAQSKLRSLLAADGIGPERGASPEGALLVAHQGEGVEFVLDGGAAMRSTVGVGDEGDLALTNRLERARQQLERERKRDLMLELPLRALDGAKSGTDAARARDEWKAAVAERAKFEAMSGEIEHLRGELESLRDQLQSLVENCDEAAKRQDALGQRMTRQYERDKEVSDAELERREATTARDELSRRTRDIERLEAEQRESQSELESLSGELESLREQIEAAKAGCDAQSGERERAETEERGARETLARWRAVWEVWEAARHQKSEEERVALLETLAQEVAGAGAELNSCRDAPTEAELRQLRRDFETLGALKREASRGLQIAVEARSRLSFRWKSDKGVAQAFNLGEGARELLGAQALGALDIPDFGLVKIKSGARGAADLQLQIEEQSAGLAARLASWNMALDELPERLDELDEARIARDRARRVLDECTRRLEEEEGRGGTLVQARNRLEDARTELEARKSQAKRFQDALKFSGLRRADVRQKVAEAGELESDAASNATRARNAFERVAHELRSLESSWNRASNRPDLLRSGIESRAAQLGRLREDGLDDEARLAGLRELQERAIKAEMAVERARSERSELGNNVDKFKVEAARREAVRLQEERSQIEQTLAAKRRDLFHLCEQDPETRRDELDATIERLEPLVGEHEARLRGLALLTAAMELQRARLGRDLAGPLNQKLGPWLSKLRGKDTHLIFSDDGAKLLRVRTKEGDATVELPFSEHSEGMKEQVAFALRLLLAQKVVSRLPSKRGPVVLDDPFTQSDSSRRAGLSDVLSEALESLQIVFVTCHPSPLLVGGDVNVIKLGEWDEPDAEEDKPRKAKGEITSQVVREESETLALF
jgi:exonuclease SbcC